MVQDSRALRITSRFALVALTVDSKPVTPLLENAGNRPAVVADRAKNVGDLQVAVADVCGAAIPFHVADVQVRDPVVVLLDVGEGVVAAAGVMSDVQVDHEQLRHAEQLFETRR